MASHPSASSSGSLPYDLTKGLPHNWKSTEESLCLLCPVEATIDKPLRLCTLRFTSTEVRPPYTVLSFPRGQDEEREFAFIDSESVTVPRIVTQVMRTTAMLSGSLFWIEEFCIDQNSAFERTVAAFFKEAYLRSAQQVIVHVGSQSALASSIYDLLLKFPPVLNINPDAPLNRRISSGISARMRASLMVESRTYRWLKHAYSQKDTHEMRLMLTSWVQFLQSPAFELGHTIQDMTIPCLAFIQCGYQKMTLQQLYVAAILSYDIISEHFAKPDSGCGLELLTPLKKGIEELKLRHDAWVMYQDPHYKSQLNLVHLISRFGVPGRFNSRHEAIFEFMSMAADSHLFLGKIWYGQSLPSIYTTIAGELFRHGDFRVPEFVQWPKTIPNLPSWVPDFGAFRQPSIDVITTQNNMHIDSFLWAGVPTAASADSDIFGPDLPLLCGLKADLGIIRMSGVVIDTVCNVGFPVRQLYKNETPDYIQICFALADLKAYCDESRDIQSQPNVFQIYSDQDDPAGALWRVPLLEAPPILGSKSPSKPYIHLGQTFLAVMHCAWQNFKFRRLEGDLTDLGFPENFAVTFMALPVEERELYYKIMTKHLEWTTYHAEIAKLGNGMFGRRPILTSKGFVGAAPMVTRKMDLIFVPRGGHVPLVLRPVLVEGGTNTGLHEVVGEAYIDGMMTGRAWEMNVSERVVQIS